jgi:hypothetical protein
MARQLRGCPVHTTTIVFVRAGDYNRSLEYYRRGADCCGLHATGHAVGLTPRGAVLTEPRKGGFLLGNPARGSLFDKMCVGKSRMPCGTSIKGPDGYPHHGRRA